MLQQGYQVTIAIEFFDQQYLAAYQAPTGASLIAGVWQTSVFLVKDKNIFKNCIDWKETADTRKKWNQHRDWLVAGSHD